MAESLVIDVALLGVWADDEAWHSDPVAVLVDLRRGDVVVEAAPVVPGNEDRGALPVPAAHDVVDQACDPCLADMDARGWVLAVHLVRRHP